MPKKKGATSEATEDTRQRRGARPDDPSYQQPAFASEEEMAVLDEGIDARMKALLKDHKQMGVR